MHPDHDSLKFKRTQADLGGPATGPLGKVLAFVASAALLVLGLMFSLAALAVVAVGGLLVGGWLWWKTRAIRRQMREAVPADGLIIEGEVIREETREETREQTWEKRPSSLRR